MKKHETYQCSDCGKVFGVYGETSITVGGERVEVEGILCKKCNKLISLDDDVLNQVNVLLEAENLINLSPSVEKSVIT